MKRYKYYFFDLDEPISVEAKSKQSARRVLEEVVNHRNYRENGYTMLALRKETVETLVEDVSIKNSKIHGMLIWTSKGWTKKNETVTTTNRSE